MKSKCLLIVVGILACIGVRATDVKLTPVQDIVDDEIKGYTITTPVYSAAISKAGQITSIKLGDLELLDGGIRMGMGGKYETPDFVKQLDPQTLQLMFPSRPLAHLKFDEKTIAITIKNQKKTWDFGFYYTLSPRAQTITSKEMGYENIALPLVKGRTAHWHTQYSYDDGSVLTVDQVGPGNHINGDDSGWFGGYSWSRGQLEVGATYTFTFSFQRGAGGAKQLSAPPFVIRSNRVGNIYNAGEGVAFALEFRKENYQKLLSVDDVVVECWTRDYWKHEVDSQTIPIDFSKLRDEERQQIKLGVLPITLKIPSKGWFETEFIIKDRSGSLKPNRAATMLSIITPNEGLLNLPLSSDAGTYEFDELLGLRCHRGNINLGELFPPALNIEKPNLPTDAKVNSAVSDDDPFKTIVSDLSLEAKEKPKAKELVADWGGLDKQMAAASEAKSKYGMTVFWLIELPKIPFKKPEMLEEALFKLVSRYKDQNKYWMLFNEPNLAMSPEDYVKNCLAPLYRAAHRADPDAKVMGPDTCGVNPGWLEVVYKAGGTMDVVDMHPYTGHSRGWEEHGMTGAWQEVRKVMAAHNDGAKEIWATESGYDWAAGRLGMTHHARNIVRQYPIAESTGIPKNHFFLYYTCFVGYLKMYVVDEEHRLLPAAAAARVQSEQLIGAEYVEKRNAGRDLQAHLYRSKNEDVWMLWSHDFATTLEVDVSSKELIATDMMGNRIKDESKSAAEKRRVTFQLSGDPIYVRVDRDASFQAVVDDLGINFARQEGVRVTASSEEKPGLAAKVVDGIWNSENTGSFDDRAWISATSLKEPSPKPAWVEVTLPSAQNISQVRVYAPSSICGLPGLRDFSVQAFDDAKSEWKSVGEVNNSDASWVFPIKFPAVKTNRIRVLITGINNGWKLEDKSDYTDMKPRLTEIEIYGAPR